jgi:hypothetical protein
VQNSEEELKHLTASPEQTGELHGPWFVHLQAFLDGAATVILQPLGT